MRKHPPLVAPPPLDMSGWANIKGNIKEEPYDPELVFAKFLRQPKKKQKLSQQKTEPKGKKANTKPPNLRRKRKREPKKETTKTKTKPQNSRRKRKRDSTKFLRQENVVEL